MTLPPPGIEPDDPFGTTPLPPPQAPPPPPLSPSPGLPPASPALPLQNTQPPRPPSQFNNPGFSPDTDAPPGYVAYNASHTGLHVPLRPTEGLRRAATVLIWVSTLLSGVFAIALYRRIAVLDSFFANSAPASDLDRWDSIVGVLGVAQIASLVAAAIMVAIWSSRAVGNAEAKTGRTIGKGMAAGGWFIPIGNLWLPFVRLREASRETRGDHRWVSRWQGGWIALIVSGQISNLSGNSGGFGQTEQELRDALSSEAGIVAFATVITVVAAFLAQRGMKAVAVTTDPAYTDAT